MTFFSRLSSRWLALIILCLGDLMIVLDTTIVNVALPSIQNNLHFSETSLVWVVNAYMLTFGGFLLLGGRLGDLFGHRKVFLWGIALFTLASFLCGISDTQHFLIAARAFQGIGGAVVSAVALSLIMSLFTEPSERAKAMGVFGFVASGGGALGVFLGGFLTNILSWHWIFLVNIPVGIIVAFLTILFLPKDPKREEAVHLDIAGSVTITSSLMLAVYAIVNGNHAGWLSTQTLALFFIASFLFLLFIGIESKTKHPLMPLHLFKIKSVLISNIIAVLWAAAMFAWFFISALYLQFILKLSPLQVGLAFLPSNLIMAALSLGVSAKLVMRFGISKTLSGGLFVASIGLGLLVFSPVNGSFLVHVLPCMVLLGLGAGIAFNPMLLAAMSGVKTEESGAASGLVNTSFMMGGAVGLAILASIAAFQTTRVTQKGGLEIYALNSGYHWAFLVGAGMAMFAALLSLKYLKSIQMNLDDINQPSH